MPRARSREEFLEDVPDEPRQFLCRVCTDHQAIHVRSTVTFLRTSKVAHLKTKGHARALEARRKTQAEPSANHTSAPNPIEASRTVELCLIDRFNGIDNNGDLMEIDPPDLFSRVSLQDGHLVDDELGKAVVFSAGETGSITEKNSQVQLEAQLDDAEYLGEHDLFSIIDPTSGIGPEREVDEHFAAERHCLEDSDEEAEAEASESNWADDHEWAPHGSKTMFMLDLLDNIPRLRLSDDHLRTILWVMRECQTPNVPSFSALRKMQSKLTKQVKIESRHHTSSLGNHFFMNHPAKLLALDWGNPLVRSLLRVYPEVEGPVKEFWQAEKWTREVDLDELSPMWANWKDPSTLHRHYYVKELAQLENGNFVIPLRWITIDDVVHAEGFDVEYDKESVLFVVHTNIIKRHLASSLQKNVLDLEVTHGPFEFSRMSHFQLHDSMPNILRETSKGKPLFRIRVMVWSDDVSGNVSKQYNAHTNVYVTNVNIPHRISSQEYFVRFCSTSPHASSSEQFVALSDDFKANVWNEAYDCELEQEILFQINPHLLPADNPQQSETSSHIGVKGNYNCRRDLVGGTEAEKESDKVYQSLYKIGTPRTSKETIQVIRWQIWTACAGHQEPLQTNYSQSGVKDKISQYWIEELLARAKALRACRISNPATRDVRLNRTSLKGEARQQVKLSIEHEIQLELWNWVVKQPPESYSCLEENDPSRSDVRAGDHYNVLLNIRGIDPHQDTPVEILHTWLLGNDKYLWHDTNKQWDKKKDGTFAVRLQSSSIDGLTLPQIRADYLVQYKNSLIGKHFKILQQLGVFHVYDLCSDSLFRLWKAAGELGALIWFPEISNMPTYLADLQILIDNMLDIWAEIDPHRIICKVKLHALTHLSDDVRRFGPAILYSTEVFECFNAIFRRCSVLSNHLAPSHDIAITLADMERFKHIVSGGWWKGTGGHYIQAGEGIRTFLVRNSDLQRRLGWAEGSVLRPGTLKLQPRTKKNTSTWRAAIGDIPIEEPSPPGAAWETFKYLVSRSGDPCRVDSWVFFVREEKTLVGRISSLLTRSGSSSTGATSSSTDVIIIIKPYNINELKDCVFDMPVLTPSDTGHLIVNPKDLLFICNAQHDCKLGTCKFSTNSRFRRQERLETTIPHTTIVHSALDRYLLNTHALHNAHLIRETLPRSLTAPIPYKTNRIHFHEGLAATLRVTGPAKRAASQAKAKETRDRKKAANARQPSSSQSRLETIVEVNGDEGP
ncbi:hypothetical protein D9615_003465 [Tricholomella constricta]|uniref:Uncharacterized protein n=1 Tax=Tricholomella constricta TaxID=117010 RepID=A0A8H5M8B2_9AGAR|nr:hypothetical protein D9615_003465 [Tricholomella constricta]